MSRLFDDLVVSGDGAARSRSFKTLPLSLAVHAVAVAVLATFSLSAVTERPVPASPIVFPSSTSARPDPRAVPAIIKSGSTRMPRPGLRPLVIADPRLPVVTDAPAPDVDPDSVDGPVGDSPVCLSGCTPGDPAGAGTPGMTGPGGAGGTGEGPGDGAGAPRRVGGDIQEPRRIHGVAPAYPELARRARVEGKVVLECVIDTDGRVTDLRVLSGPPLLTDAAADAVRRWTYSPTRLNGRPVRVIMTVTVRFTLYQG